MIELVLGTYGVLCWLVFKKWKLVPTNAYTVCTAILIALAGMGLTLLMLMRFHPTTKDGRLYVYTTPIVPLVRGQVIEVMPEGAAVKEGDVLFRIDPDPYQFEVDRLEAQLAGANSSVAELEEALNGAIAATEQARANLRASESDFDRQAREDLERASQALASAGTQAELARTQEGRYAELLKTGAVSQLEYDRRKTQLEVADAELKRAEAAERQAAEKIASGGDRMTSAREAVEQAAAQERQARIAVEAGSGGVNPEVRAIMASLDAARWDLKNTVVRAPADGYTTQVMLRRGQMAVPMPLAPVMVFVHGDKPILMASFPQNVIAVLKPGQDAELAFKAHPGRIFKAKLAKILPVTAEGQLLASGQLRAATPAKSAGRILVAFEYGEDVAALGLPGGAAVQVAVYTEHLHALSVVRKILLRIKGWENYIFLP